MPMIDHACTNDECKHEFEVFRHLSAVSDTAPCPYCHMDAPKSSNFQRIIQRPPSNAQRFDPVALDWKPGPGGEKIYSYPGSNRDPVDAGYQRVYLNTLSEVDKHVKSVAAGENELRRFNLYAEKAVFDERTKLRHEHLRAAYREKGMSGQITEMVMARTLKRREEKFSELIRRETNFHSQAFSFNQSNRQAHTDVTTGWKDKR